MSDYTPKPGDYHADAQTLHARQVRDDLITRLRDITANLDRYIDRRASELARPSTDAIRRAAADGGLRQQLVNILRDARATSVWDVADRIATTIEGNLLDNPPAWECACGALNHGQWTSRSTCEACGQVTATPDAATHYRLASPPAENRALADRLARLEAKANR